MAIDNFIPEVWSDSINVALRKNLVFARLCTTKWSGDIANVGDTVNILGVTTGSVATYDAGATLSYGDLSDSKTQLVVNQADAFAFGVDDVDAIQALPGLTEQAASDYAYKLADKMEQYIASLADTSAEVGGYVDYNTAGSGILTTSNVLTALGEVVVKLDEANVPSVGRWGILSPAVYNIVVQAQIANLQQETVWGSGEAMNVMGLTLFKSNNVVKTDATTDIKCLFGQGDAIAFANQLVKVEALRLESAFRDGVRGLNVYGAKVVNKSQLVILNVDTV